MLGIGSYAFRWQVGIRDRVPATPLRAVEILDRASQLGVGLVQFADNVPLHILPADEIAEVGRKAQASGIALELGMSGCAQPLVETYLEIARQLNVHLLRIAPSAEESAGSDAEIAGLFRVIVPEAKQAGVVLAVENHFHLPSPRLVRILSAVGNASLGVCLDVANSIACCEWPDETVGLLAPYAVNLHLKDFRIALDPHGVGVAFVGTPLGQGLLDIGGVYAALAKSDRRVNTVLEHWLPWQGTFEATRRLEDEWLEQSVAAGKTWIATSAKP